MDILDKADALRDLLEVIERHPGSQVLAKYYLAHIEKLKQDQLALDPFTQAEEIKRIQIEVAVITSKLAQPFSFYLNHPDVKPLQKFSITQWFKNTFSG